MSLDPMISMAVAVQARKGVYALLLGSGVSRSSGVPTAWEVVVDLIRRIAALAGEEPPTDPAAWYQDRFGKDPSYSDLLGELAKSPADRSQLLRGYFEPTDDEREEGLKVPTDAHRAIARMVAAGHIKVILTTNFDRLVEQALAEVGVTPNVLSSPATVAGMTPLQHSDCTLIKLHGDYTDLETKNTLDELSEYSSEMNTVLDQVLTECGLIVCGWSGDWDPALRDAVLRCTRHRFSTFWLRRSDLSEDAQRVADARQAVEVEIRTADECFLDLEEKVRSIEESRTAHPLSPEVAAATTKRLLSESRFLIRLEDLLIEEAERVREALDGADFSLSAPKPDEESVRARAERAHAVASILSAMLRVGCYWGSDEHHRIWRRVLERIASFGTATGTITYAWQHMRYLPAAFAFYSAGIAALAAERYETVRFLLTGCVVRDGDEEVPLIENVNGREAFWQDASKLLFPPKGRKTPGSDWLHERLGPEMSRLVGGEEQFTLLFHRFELLVSMCFRQLALDGEISAGLNGDWMPDGRFMWHRFAPLYTPGLFKSEIEKQGAEWPPLKVGLFKGDPEAAKSIIGDVEKLWHKHSF